MPCLTMLPSSISSQQGTSDDDGQNGENATASSQEERGDTQDPLSSGLAGMLRLHRPGGPSNLGNTSNTGLLESMMIAREQQRRRALLLAAGGSGSRLGGHQSLFVQDDIAAHLVAERQRALLLLGGGGLMGGGAGAAGQLGGLLARLPGSSRPFSTGLEGLNLQRARSLGSPLQRATSLGSSLPSTLGIGSQRSQDTGVASSAVAGIVPPDAAPSSRMDMGREPLRPMSPVTFLRTVRQTRGMRPADFPGDSIVLDNMEQNTRKGRTGTFPQKLYQALSDLEKEGRSNIAAWLPKGQAFVIYNPRAFDEDVMKKYFRMNHFSSFQRQLNLYEFGRIAEGPDKGAYFHELFHRGRPILASQIRRNKIKGESNVTGVKLNSSQSSARSNIDGAATAFHKSKEDNSSLSGHEPEQPRNRKTAKVAADEKSLG